MTTEDESTDKSKVEPDAVDVVKPDTQEIERASDAVPLFALSEEDAQIMARDLSLEPVTPEQMERVRKWVDAGFDNWRDVLETAVIESKTELEM